MEDFYGALKRGPRGENSGATPRQEAVERPKTVLGNFVVNNLRQGEVVEGRRYTVLDGPQLLLNVAHVNLSCFIQRLYAHVYELRRIGHYVSSATAYTKLAISIYSRFRASFAPTPAGTRRGKRNSNGSALQISKLYRLNRFNNRFLHVYVYVRVCTCSLKRRGQRMVKKEKREEERRSELEAVVRGTTLEQLCTLVSRW